MFTRERIISFTRGIYERRWLDEDHTACTHDKVGDRLYSIELLNEETIKFTRDGESKTILVRPETGDYVYSCKKSYIRARRCAEGLFETLGKCFRDDGTVWNSATLYTVCDWAIDEMRPAPKRPPMTLNEDRILDALTWSAQNKGCGVTVVDGWIAYASYSRGMSDAELRCYELDVRIPYALAAEHADLERKAFLYGAACYIADKLSDMERGVA